MALLSTGFNVVSAAPFTEMTGMMSPTRNTVA